MLVKNEADIVANVIKDAEKWADRIFIMDNGSTDGTWEIVQSLKNDIVVPWKQDFRPYSNGLRADVFNEFRHEASDGDWWCFKLDADEFYYDNPKEFLAKMNIQYQAIKRTLRPKKNRIPLNLISFIKADIPITVIRNKEGK